MLLQLACRGLTWSDPILGTPIGEYMTAEAIAVLQVGRSVFFPTAVCRRDLLVRLLTRSLEPSYTDNGMVDGEERGSMSLDEPSTPFVERPETPIDSAHSPPLDPADPEIEICCEDEEVPPSNQVSLPQAILLRRCLLSFSQAGAASLLLDDAAAAAGEEQPPSEQQQQPLGSEGSSLLELLLAHELSTHQKQPAAAGRRSCARYRIPD